MIYKMKNGNDSNSEEEENEEPQLKKSKDKKEEREEKKEGKKEKKMLNKKRKEEKNKNDDEDEDENNKKNDNDIIIGEKEVKFILDDKKRITVHKFKGKIKVDIREFYDDQGEMKPGKRGISLSLENWQKLKGFIDDIEESIDNLK